MRLNCINEFFIRSFSGMFWAIFFWGGMNYIITLCIWSPTRIFRELGKDHLFLKKLGSKQNVRDSREQSRTQKGADLYRSDR